VGSINDAVRRLYVDLGLTLDPDLGHTEHEAGVDEGLKASGDSHTSTTRRAPSWIHATWKISNPRVDGLILALGQPGVPSTRATASAWLAAMSGMTKSAADERMNPATRATGTSTNMLAWMP